MGLPNQPVTLTPAQIAEVNRALASLRHDVNNHLSLVIAAAEILNRRPDLALRYVPTILAQPEKITEIVAKFSTVLESALNIERANKPAA